jgi:putative ABC transport system ATP-binding protein
MNAVTMTNIGKVYEGKVPHKALENISLAIEAGEFVGIMGPSGSGKTTLLQLVATIDTPTSGQLLIGGKNPEQMKKQEMARFRRRELGFIFQDFNLLSTLTVEENMVLPLTLERERVSVMEEKVAAVAAKLGIEGILKKRTYEISGGQAQRAAIGRAIIHSPQLMLADEPTGNLDSKASRDVMETLERINGDLATTILLVTHDALAASYCSRIIFIKDGRLFHEVHRGDSARQAFFQRVLDVLSLMGGNAHDLSSVRV